MLVKSITDRYRAILGESTEVVLDANNLLDLDQDSTEANIAKIGKFFGERKLGVSLVCGEEHPSVFITGRDKQGKDSKLELNLHAGDATTITMQDYLQAMAEIIKVVVKTAALNSQIVVNICGASWGHPDFDQGKSYEEHLKDFSERIMRTVGVGVEANFRICDEKNYCSPVQEYTTDRAIPLVDLHFNESSAYTVAAIKESEESLRAQPFLLLKFSPRFELLTVGSNGCLQQTKLGHLDSESLFPLKQDIDTSHLFPFLGRSERFEEFFALSQGKYVTDHRTKRGIIRFLDIALCNIASRLDHDDFYSQLKSDLDLDIEKDELASLVAEIRATGSNEQNIMKIIESQDINPKRQLIRSLVKNYMRRAAKILKESLDGTDEIPNIEDLKKIVISGQFNPNTGNDLYYKIFKFDAYRFARKAFLEVLNSARIAEAFTEEDIYVHNTNLHGSETDLITKLRSIRTN